jgi:hypothetical protein
MSDSMSPALYPDPERWCPCPDGTPVPCPTTVISEINAITVANNMSDNMSPITPPPSTTKVVPLSRRHSSALSQTCYITQCNTNITITVLAA